jgi:hypothetical protein
MIMMLAVLPIEVVRSAYLSLPALIMLTTFGSLKPSLCLPLHLPFEIRPSRKINPARLDVQTLVIEWLS